MNPYACIKKQHISQGSYPCDIFTFTNLYKDVIILEVFKYPENVYVIKFFQKKNKLSKNRYSIQYSLNEIKNKGYKNGSQNFIRTLDTVLKIGIDYLKKDDIASFGFMGAPKPKELEENKQDDGTVHNTTRYSVYKSYSLRYFNPEKFKFIDSKTSSIFFIRNEKNKDNLPKEKIMRIIKNDIIPQL